MAPEPPLLLIDVDGVLSVFGFDAAAPPPGRPALIDGFPHWLSLEAAAALRRVIGAFEPVWCTGWEDRADEHLPYLLDLPAGWPHVPIKASRGPGRGVAGHWKLDAIDLHRGRDRPLAWVDDGLDAECDLWADARPAPTLLVPVDPAVGMTDADAETLLRWAESMQGSMPAGP